MKDGCPCPATDESCNRFCSVLLACESYALRAPLRFAVLAVLALLTLSVTALRIAYETNDDVFMTMIVAGRGFCANPDEHLIFSNILLGHVLKWLYLSWPQFPWYGGYLLLTHYFSLVAMLYVTLVIERESTAGESRIDPANEPMRRSFRRRIAAYLVCFATVELVLLNSLQFTSTAFIAAQAGIFLLWLAARRRANKNLSQNRPQTGGQAHFAPKTPQNEPVPDGSGIGSKSQAAVLGPLCAAVAMIVLAGLIRLESLGLAFLVATPLFGLLAFHGSRKALILVAAATSLAWLLVLAAANFNRASYEGDPIWSRFYAYNELRCKFNDYEWTSYTPETAHVFTAVGWTRNDHDILARWFFDDPELYSEANLSSVLAAYPWKTSRLTPSYLVQILRRPFRDRPVWALTLVLPFMLAGMGGPRYTRRTILVCAFMALLLIVLIGVNNKVPPMRLYFPLMAFPLSATLLFPTARAALSSPAKAPRGLRNVLRHWTTQPRLTRAIVAMLVVGTVLGVYRQCRRTMRNERDRISLQAFLTEARSKPHKLYVCWEAALPFELVSPLDSLASWSNISFLNLTWTQRTPWSEELKRRFDISNLARAIYEREDIVLIATETHRLLFAKFAKEHFAAEVEFVPWSQPSTRFVAGRFQRRIPHVDTGSNQRQVEYR